MSRMLRGNLTQIRYIKGIFRYSNASIYNYCKPIFTDNTDLLQTDFQRLFSSQNKASNS